MRRILLYIVILGATLAVPTESFDIGKLLPVQVVAIYKENDKVILQTDTQDMGIGGNAIEALQDLKDTAAGIIYLDTAQYLLLGEDTAQAVEDLRGELKASVRVCAVEETVDLTETAAFLDAHGQIPRLKEWKSGMELPVLSKTRNSLTFLKKVENSA